MRICLSGIDLAAGEPLDPLLDAAVALGAEGVELWHPDNTGGDIEGAVARVRAAGLEVASFCTPTELVTSDERWQRDQKLLIDAVEQAGAAGVARVNTYFGFPGEPDDEGHIAAYAQRLAPVIAAAERAGVTVTLENEFDCFGTDPLGSDPTRRPESVARLLAAVDSVHFGLTFDPTNAYFAGLDPRSAFGPLLPFVRHVHVKDGRPVDPAGPGQWHPFADSGRSYQTCAVGAGDVDWPGLLTDLAAAGYPGWLVVEPHNPTGRLAAWTDAVRFLRQHVVTATGAPDPGSTSGPGN